jgi:hypothetical protein
MLLNSVEDQLELTFTHLPTCFSRLAFLASVRDSYTGRYLHEGWAMQSSAEQVHEILQRTHKDVFNQVLKMPLVKFGGELKGYLESLANTRQRTITLWLELETYRDMIPEGVSPVSKAFFLSQIKMALKVLLTIPEWSVIQAQHASLHPLLVLPPPHHLEN